MENELKEIKQRLSKIEQCLGIKPWRFYENTPTAPEKKTEPSDDVPDENIDYSLSTVGSKIYRNGVEFRPRGFSIPDPGFMANTNEFGNKPALDCCKELIELGANCIRLPIHPDNNGNGWLDFGDISDYDKNYIKPLVEYCASRKCYVIVDNHWVDNWNTYDVESKTFTFWDYFAYVYRENPFVIFEMINEPTYPDNSEKFFDFIVKDTYQLIRKHSKNHIIIGSPSWSHRPHEIAKYIPDNWKNYSLTLHTYPDDLKGKHERYENTGLKYPLFVTEFGYGRGLYEDDNGKYSGASSDPRKQKTLIEWGEGDEKWFFNWLKKYTCGDIGWCYACSSWTPSTHVIKNGEWKLINMQEALGRLSE